MIWRAFELHTHTFHSDGRQSLQLLAENAARLGYDAVMLTDHNTVSGFADKKEAEKASSVFLIPGEELTTFYGHILCMGISRYVEWRHLNPLNLETAVTAVHAQGGLVGLAHPYRIGTPIGTGCHMDYKIDDFTQIDYMEVWSGIFPPIRGYMNAPAFAFWRGLLDRHIRLPAVSGWDWHAPEPCEESPCCTYLGVNQELSSENVGAQACEAVKNGRICVSMGPLIRLEIDTDAGAVTQIGDTVSGKQLSDAKFRIRVTGSGRRRIWSKDCSEEFRVILTSNLGDLKTTHFRSELQEDYLLEFDLKNVDFSAIHYLFAELYGEISHTKTMIGFTNPIFLQ